MGALKLTAISTEEVDRIHLCPKWFTPETASEHCCYKLSPSRARSCILYPVGPRWMDRRKLPCGA